MPLATILVFDVLEVLLAGTLVVEYIFAIPGLGLVTYEGLVNQDTAVVMASTLLGVLVAVLGYLLQDLAYVYLDPRTATRARDLGPRTRRFRRSRRSATSDPKLRCRLRHGYRKDNRNQRGAPITHQ